MSLSSAIGAEFQSWLAARPYGWETVHRVADAHRPAFRRAATIALRSAAPSLSLQALASAIVQSHGHVAMLVNAAVSRVGASLAMTMPPLMVSAAVETAEALNARAERQHTFRSAQGVAVAFDRSNPEAIRWAAEQSSLLIRGLTEETREAVREILARAIRDGIPPRQSARLIQQTIGLSTQQALAVERVRQQILSNPGGLVKAGTLRIRVPRGGASEAFVERRVAQYSGRLLAQRALLIARTETIRAAVAGQNLLWRQALAEGLLRGTERRRWIITPDDRLCPSCEAMDGEEVGLDELFESDTLGAVDGPPLHPDCRCGLGLAIEPRRRRR